MRRRLLVPFLTAIIIAVLTGPPAVGHLQGGSDPNDDLLRDIEFVQFDHGDNAFTVTVTTFDRLRTRDIAPGSAPLWINLAKPNSDLWFSIWVGREGRSLEAGYACQGCDESVRRHISVWRPSRDAIRVKGARRHFRRLGSVWEWRVSIGYGQGCDNDWCYFDNAPDERPWVYVHKF